MSPHLRYAQAIRGRVSGRGVGIIDTLHLVEVARAIEALGAAPGLAPLEQAALRRWFADYVEWMTTHEYGVAERDARNNHATCWVLQVAAFARLAGANGSRRRVAASASRRVLLEQMAADGSFPQETRRTKPYAYSLFNLEALAAIAQLLTTPDGRPVRLHARGRARPAARRWRSWCLSCAAARAGPIPAT